MLESTPVLVVPLMEYVYENGLQLPDLRLLIVGSDYFATEDYRTMLARFGAEMRIINSYGTTETTIDSSYFECTNAEDVPVTVSGHTPIGRPLANTQFYILDQGLRPVPIGVVGELYMGGPAVTRGYFQREDLTAERFINDPFVSDGCTKQATWQDGAQTVWSSSWDAPTTK